MLLALIAIMILAAHYRETIIHWLQPHKEDIVATSWAWLVPIAILVVLSIPPLVSSFLPSSASSSYRRTRV